jgi:serine phosphatase RsbU (regulator of sigma subunit)
LFRIGRQHEHEPRAVEAMQQAVLPGELPRLEETELAATYAPAGRHIEVGGDWYDAFTLDSETVVITVGDVTGHGLEAAAMMGQLRNALRAYAADGRGPGGILGSLNQLMHQLGSDRYATAVVALYEPSTGRCRWSHAGHPPPLRFSTDDVSFLPARGVGGPLLGAVPTATYPEAALHLHHGEGLLLYTDGLIERRGASIDDGLALLAGGLQRFARLGAEEICTELVATIFADRPRQDDICQLIVRRSP